MIIAKTANFGKYGSRRPKKDFIGQAEPPSEISSLNRYGAMHVKFPLRKQRECSLQTINHNLQTDFTLPFGPASSGRTRLG